MLANNAKRLTARLAVLSILATGTLMAAPAHAEFRGGGVMHSFSGCSDYGWADGQVNPVRARYRPSEFYEPPSRVSVFDPQGGGTQFLVYDELDPGPTRYRGRGVGLYTGFWVWEQRPRIRVNWRNVVLPRNETFENADAIDMRVTVNHYAGLAGCSVTMDLTLYRN